MRITLDENLPARLKRLFSSAGHDCDTADDEGLSGADDALIYQRCQSEQRVLITLDLDFSDIRAYPPSAGRGVTCCQDIGSIKALAAHALHLMEAESPDGRLWIVEPRRVRIRES